MNIGDFSIFEGLQFLSSVDLKFLLYRACTSLVRVTPRQFILFVTTVKGVISLISFSACLSFDYRKPTDLFELILYPATLLKLLIRFKSSQVEFLGSIQYTIISSANSDILTFSFPICILLTSFFFFNCSSQGFEYYIEQMGRE